MKSLYSIVILAQLNAREWLRLKFFHLIMFFAVVFILFSHLLGTLAFAVQKRLVYDFGLGGLEIALVLIASLIGSHSIQREIDRKTLFVLLSRPLPRRNIVLGAWLSIVVLCFLFYVGFLASLLVSGSGEVPYLGLLLASMSSLLKALVVAAFALACGLLVRPILALGATVCYWVLCYSLPDIEFFVSKLESNSMLLSIVKVSEKILPQFYNYNWKSYYFIENPPIFSDFMWALFHSLAWSFFWLFLAALFFKRKEIV